jgi:hypothetical protein
MYFFNGHGETVKPSEGNSYITLEPGQFVIMNVAARYTKGSSWMQDVIWSNILSSTNPYQFVESIELNINKNKHVGVINDVFGFFGTFGTSGTLDTCPDNTICPNITLESKYDWVKRGRVEYSDRFGLFKVPIIIDNEKLSNLKREYPKISRDIIFIEKVSRSDNELLDREQEEVVVNKVTTINESTDLYSVINMLKLAGITKFIIFCNVCRYYEYSQRHEYSRESLRIACPLTYLLEEIKYNPDGMNIVMSRLAPIDTEMAKKMIRAKPFIPKSFKKKYLKYKTKYLELKKKIDG